MAQNTSSQNPLCSICHLLPTNHVCSFDIVQNKQCGIPVCSVCKTEELGMEDTEPYRCRQHAPLGSSITSSPFKMSGSSSTSTSATSTAMEKVSHVVTTKHAPLSSSITSSSFKMSGSSSTSTSATSTAMAKVSHVVTKKRKNDAINDNTAGPKYVIDETKGSRKRSFIWKFFAPFNIAFHPLMKEHRICLICREKGIDKALKVGEKCSTGNLITHLCTHPKENEEYMKSTAEAEAEEESDAKKRKSLQMTINFPVFTSVRDNFLNACAKWVVEDFQPFNVGESKSSKQ